MKPSAIATVVGLCLWASQGLADDLAIGSELSPDYYASSSTVNNRLQIEQVGTRNQAESAQVGRENTAILTQRGSGNDAAILQSGGYHSADISQVGVGHDARISQKGHGKRASIDQRGSYGSADIRQLSASKTPVHISQYSQGRMKVQVIK